MFVASPALLWLETRRQAATRELRRCRRGGRAPRGRRGQRSRERPSRPAGGAPPGAGRGLPAGPAPCPGARAGRGPVQSREGAFLEGSRPLSHNPPTPSPCARSSDSWCSAPSSSWLPLAEPDDVGARRTGPSVTTSPTTIPGQRAGAGSSSAVPAAPTRSSSRAGARRELLPQEAPAGDPIHTGAAFPSRQGPPVRPNEVLGKICQENYEVRPLATVVERSRLTTSPAPTTSGRARAAAPRSRGALPRASPPGVSRGARQGQARESTSRRTLEDAAVLAAPALGDHLELLSSARAAAPPPCCRSIPGSARGAHIGSSLAIALELSKRIGAIGKPRRARRRARASVCRRGAAEHVAVQHS